MVRSNICTKRAGHTYTTGLGISWNLPTLLAFDGIFLAGNAVPDVSVLVSYVGAGGNIYLAGGTGVGGAAAEAARWDPLLNTFGLDFGPQYNGLVGNINISSSHQIFTNVSVLYQASGNPVFDLATLDPRSQILVTDAQGRGLYAVYDDSTTPPSVPEPATLALMGLGLVGIGYRRRQLMKA